MYGIELSYGRQGEKREGTLALWFRGLWSMMNLARDDVAHYNFLLVLCHSKLKVREVLQASSAFSIRMYKIYEEQKHSRQNNPDSFVNRGSIAESLF